MPDTTWRTASRCQATNGCVEIGQRSCANGSTCVEVGSGGPEILIRDSTDPDGPCLAFSPAEWARLLHAIKEA